MSDEVLSHSHVGAAPEARGGVLADAVVVTAVNPPLGLAVHLVLVHTVSW